MPNQAAIDPRLALPFDLMPELVADRFRAIPELSRSPLYNGARIGQHEIHTRHSYEVYAQQMIKGRQSYRGLGSLQKRPGQLSFQG